MRSVADIFRSYAKFDAEGRHVWGTDRESNHHYGDAYEQLFYGSKMVDVRVTQHRTELLPERTTRRGDVKLMLEIGVADGNSLLAWREIFPNALIVGMDLHHPCWRADGFLKNRDPHKVEHHLADARNRDDCIRVTCGRKFDLIVDDASHQVSDIMTTLLWMWPSVKRGGVYVIEDLDNDFCTYFKLLLPHADIIDTSGPHIAHEPLIVLRKDE